MSLNPEDLKSDNHSWMLGQVMLEDGPLIVRLNESAKEFAGHAELGIKLGFAIPFNADSSSGMPDPEENDQLNEFEDVITSTVESSTTGIHVMTLTTQSVKELIFYIGENADIASMHQYLEAEATSHEVQCMAVRDPDWSSYFDFLPNE